MVRGEWVDRCIGSGSVLPKPVAKRWRIGTPTLYEERERLRVVGWGGDDLYSHN